MTEVSNEELAALEAAVSNLLPMQRNDTQDYAEVTGPSFQAMSVAPESLLALAALPRLLFEVRAGRAAKQAASTRTRYFIGHDQSSHRYLVPYAARRDWKEWCELPDDDERAWEVPEHIEAIRIDGAFVHFVEPTVMS